MLRFSSDQKSKCFASRPIRGRNASLLVRSEVEMLRFSSDPDRVERRRKGGRWNERKFKHKPGQTLIRAPRHPLQSKSTPVSPTHKHQTDPPLPQTPLDRFRPTLASTHAARLSPHLSSTRPPPPHHQRRASRPNHQQATCATHTSLPPPPRSPPIGRNTHNLAPR
jgi:hypothetical protein